MPDNIPDYRQLPQIKEMNPAKCFYANALAALPNNRLAIGMGTQIELYNVQTGNRFLILKADQDQDHNIRCLTMISEDTLVSGGGSSIKLWNIQNGNCIRTLIGHSNTIYSVVEVDNHTLASASEDNTIKLWDLETGKCIDTLNGQYNNGISSLAMLSNNLLASGGFSDGIRLWDIRSRRCIKKIPSHTTVLSLTKLPNGTFAAGTNAKKIDLYDIQSGNHVRSLRGNSNSIDCLIVSSEILVSSGRNGINDLWDIKTNQCLGSISILTHPSQETMIGRACLTMLSNGIFATGGSAFYAIKLCDIQSKQIVGSLGLKHLKSITQSQMLSDGILATGSYDTTIKLWNIQTEECIHTLIGHSAYITNLELVSSEILASSCRDYITKLWNIKTGQCIFTFKYQSALPPSSINYFRTKLLSNRWLACGSWHSGIDLWDIKTGQHMGTLQGNPNFLQEFAELSNGILISEEPKPKNQIIEFWDNQNGKYIRRTLDGYHSNGINCFTIFPNNILASAAYDTIKLWNTQTGECNYSLKTNFPINHLIVLSNELLACVGKHKAVIEVWNIQTYQLIQTLQLPLDDSQESYFLEVLSNGTFITANDFNTNKKTLKVWDIHTGKCLLTIGQENCKKFNHVKISSNNVNIIGVSYVEQDDTRTLKLWNTQSGECVRILKNFEDNYESEIKIFSHGVIGHRCSKSKIQLWDNTDNLNRTLEEFDFIHDFFEGANGNIIVIGTRFLNIRVKTTELYDTKTGKRTILGEGPSINYDGMLPNGSIILRDSKTIKLWNTETFQCVTLNDNSQGRIAILPNGNFVIHHRDNRKTIKFWDIQTKECIYTLNNINDFKILSNDILASWNDNIIRFWDIKTWQCTKSLIAHSDFVEGLELNNDTLASWGDSNIIKLWDIKTWQCIRTFEHDKIQSVKFANSTLASLSNDSIKIWDTRKGLCRHVLTIDGSHISKFKMLSDAILITYTTAQKRLDLWNVKTGQCIYTIKDCNAFNQLEFDYIEIDQMNFDVVKLLHWPKVQKEEKKQLDLLPAVKTALDMGLYMATFHNDGLEIQYIPTLKSPSITSKEALRALINQIRTTTLVSDILRPQDDIILIKTENFEAMDQLQELLESAGILTLASPTPKQF
ncbi:MAG: WD40 repeat domain-containing protein [Gammaproteobacteria bacterium]|nr:WD40 repeat domain-containing protein [Gammaproteobacteria bacterium]